MSVFDNVRAYLGAVLAGGADGLNDARGLSHLHRGFDAARDGNHQAAVDAFSASLRLLDVDRPQRAAVRRGLLCSRHALGHGDAPGLMGQICATPLERHAMLHSMDARHLATQPEKDLLVACLDAHLEADDWLSLPVARRIADRVLHGILHELDGEAWLVLLDELMEKLPFDRWLPATQWQAAPRLGLAVQRDVATRHPIRTVVAR